MFQLWMWFAGALAASDPPLRAGAEQRRIWFSTGWDPTVQIDLGASVPIIEPSSGVALTGEAFVGAPATLLGRGVPSAALGAGVEGSVSRGVGRFTGAVYGTARTASDVTGFFLAFGTTKVLRVGLGSRQGTLALEGSLASAWSTYRAPSEAVRAMYGDRGGAVTADAPRAGFFLGSSQRARFGLAASARISPRVALSLSSGYAYTPHVFGRVMDVPVVPMPFYAELGCGVSL